MELRLIHGTRASRRSWKYYDRDGAIFRGPADFPIVDDIWTGTAWERYRDDRQKPVFLGDQIPTSALPIAAIRLSATTNYDPR
jgi:hypothetical protein